MGKAKKGYNWKAREQKPTKCKQTDVPEVESNLLGVDLASSTQDGSNALVLPGSKRKRTESEDDDVPQKKVKKMTKKERKKMEKLKADKEKKAKRAELFEKLQAVQASQEEMKMFSSIADVHSQKFKTKKKETCDVEKKIYTVRGSNKLSRKMSIDEDEEKESDAESIDTSDISTDEEEEEKEPKDANKEEDKDCKEPSSSSAQETAAKEATASTTQSEPSKRKDSDPKEAEPVEKKPVVNIAVNRKPDIQNGRMKLPIIGEEQVIMEKINDNAVTIVSGETGSGKTTQVPQFLYEAGYAHGGGIIGVTEPRRVAAINMSKRVAEELNLTSREVSYQIRYEGNVTPDTRIKFMTDGVLLREIQQDFFLSKYSVIILDEAHERSVFTDILIGLLSRIVPFRIKKKMSPLKLVIMSATLDKVGFLENPRLFTPRPAETDVAARQFPVTVHFAARTDDDYLAAAYKKTCEIHQKEAPGGILVFLTGQQEVTTLCRKLKKIFPYDRNIEVEPVDKSRKRKKNKNKTEEEVVLPDVNLSKYSVAPVEDGEDKEKTDQILDTADIDDYDLEENLEDIADQGLEITTKEPLWVLPLYSLLPSERQNQVFLPPPPGCRLCVVATNVAETSLTIPNISYVVDTGKIKKKFYDKVTGVSTFKISWASKASADQRKGRAGRVGPGKCFRLFSSAVFTNHFEAHTIPEMIQRPVDDLVLQMKAMGISKVANFPFPTPPDSEQIKAAEKLLLSLGALKVKKGQNFISKGKRVEPTPVITDLGQSMAEFPVAPRYARMLAGTKQTDLLPYVIIAVAALSVDELFVDFQNAEKEDENAKLRKERMKKVKRIWTSPGQSHLLGDLAMLVKAVGACEAEGMSYEFCSKNGIRFKAMQEIRKLRSQLTREVNLKLPGTNLCIDPNLAPPTEAQMLELRKIVAAGLADHVARLCLDPLPDTASRHKNAYQCAEMEDFVYTHPTSALYKQKMDYVVYQQIHITSRPYMKGVVAIEPHWLPQLAPYHCTFSKPLEDPPPSWGEDTGKVMCHMKATFGSRGWDMGSVLLEYPAFPERYSWFGRFLMEGKVIPELAKYSSDLLSNPSTMIKTWSRLQPRTEILKKALSARGVDSRKALLEEWKNDRKYLLHAFLQWLPESMHWQVTDNWPPVSTSS